MTTEMLMKIIDTYADSAFDQGSYNCPISAQVTQNWRAEVEKALHQWIAENYEERG